VKQEFLKRKMHCEASKQAYVKQDCETSACCGGDFLVPRMRRCERTFCVDLMVELPHLILSSFTRGSLDGSRVRHFIFFSLATSCPSWGHHCPLSWISSYNRWLYWITWFESVLFIIIRKSSDESHRLLVQRPHWHKRLWSPSSGNMFNMASCWSSARKTPLFGYYVDSLNYTLHGWVARVVGALMKSTFMNCTYSWYHGVYPIFVMSVDIANNMQLRHWVPSLTKAPSYFLVWVCPGRNHIEEKEMASSTLLNYYMSHI
jgi:hypothetical protein